MITSLGYIKEDMKTMIQFMVDRFKLKLRNEGPRSDGKDPREGSRRSWIAPSASHWREATPSRWRTKGFAAFAILARRFSREDLFLDVVWVECGVIALWVRAMCWAFFILVHVSCAGCV